MYNQLNQNYWVTKQGEKLYPESDMTAEHIINVMNMLTNRAKSNDERVKMLKTLLTEEEYQDMRNKLRSTDTVTSESLKETTLFKALTQGLKSAIKNRRVERNNVFSEPNYEDTFVDDPHPVDISMI
jgi:hypothetical protein